MYIFDRYILSKFYLIFFLCYTSLVGIYFILDATSNFGDLSSSGTTLQVLKAVPFYYFLNSFVILDIGFPILILVAAMATIAHMIRYHEMIALLAMGVSPARIFVLFLIGALGLSCLFTAVREVYLPNKLVEVSAGLTEFVQKKDVHTAIRSYDDKSSISIEGEQLYFSENRLIKPYVMLRQNCLSKYGKRLISTSGVYEEADDNHPAGWLLQGVSSPSELLKNPSLSDSDGKEIVIYSPFDTAWLNEDEVFVATNVKPILLITGDNWFQYGSVFDLNAALNDPTFKSKTIPLTIRVHTRFWRPFTDLIPLFLGVPLMLLRLDKNALLMIVQGMVLSGAFLGAQLLAASLGERWNMPELGIWGALFIFIPIAATIYSELLKKENSSTKQRMIL